jgi:hypothetical protein
VIAEDRRKLWMRNGPLTDPETRADLVKLLKKKNTTLSANILDGDIDRVISSRISYSAAKDLVIYPEELRHKADTYVGSAGSSL